MSFAYIAKEKFKNDYTQEIVDFSWINENMIKIIGTNKIVVYEQLHNLIMEVQ